MTASKTSNGTGAYADVNGLKLYYEVHGTGRPLVLIHGAFSAIGTSFGQMIPGFAAKRQAIGLDLQAHGRTADIDRPMSAEQLADDVAALIRYLGHAQADVMGYSMGGGVALYTALRHPDLVRKLVLTSVSFNMSGIHPGIMDGMGEMRPEMLVGSPWHDEYMRIAPHPEAFGTLFAKKQAMDQQYKDLPAEAIKGLKSPVLTIIGDSDIVRPEHAVEIFRLVGGGVFGDMAGMPQSQLAILPGTSHTKIVERADWIVPMVNEFLDKE